VVRGGVESSGSRRSRGLDLGNRRRRGSVLSDLLNLGSLHAERRDRGLILGADRLGGLRDDLRLGLGLDLDDLGLLLFGLNLGLLVGNSLLLGLLNLGLLDLDVLLVEDLLATVLDVDTTGGDPVGDVRPERLGGLGNNRQDRGEEGLEVRLVDLVIEDDLVGSNGLTGLVQVGVDVLSGVGLVELVGVTRVSSVQNDYSRLRHSKSASNVVKRNLQSVDNAGKDGVARVVGAKVPGLDGMGLGENVGLVGVLLAETERSLGVLSSLGSEGVASDSAVGSLDLLGSSAGVLLGNLDVSGEVLVVLGLDTDRNGSSKLGDLGLYERKTRLNVGQVKLARAPCDAVNDRLDRTVPNAQSRALDAVVTGLDLVLVNGVRLNLSLNVGEDGVNIGLENGLVVDVGRVAQRLVKRRMRRLGLAETERVERVPRKARLLGVWRRAQDC